ncbi:MAG TPA: DUF4153 domain-containing protein [Hymenobacter sp.]|jgi:hypothetical protein|uniref:DUF4153 domain-containing protein n=1 Tax=Hymenobacter sp. TaxID=1898978 RepID=UPI002ED9D417
MTLPSLQRLTTGAIRVWQRFPLALLCGFVLGGISIYYNHLEFEKKSALSWFFPALSTAGLGLTLLLTVALLAERHRWPAVWRWGAQAGAVALLGTWYWLVPSEGNLEWGLRLVLLGVGLHLSVSAAPHLAELRHGADTPGFWRYNETLFLRILTAVLYSGVLFVGCSLALLAIANLFDVELNEHIYTDLFVVLGTVFNTWFFLAGVPEDFAALEAATESYPKGLKLFTQFVLLPLVVLYLGILYAYMGRIVLLWTLPKGWVSTLILALAVAGIFALLLIHPIRHSAENAWIRTFARWFYRALFPLLALLAVAIGTRVRDYGITEERYFVLVLAAWLFGMAIYFLVRRGQGIVWVPTSLALVAFLSAAGPWGAFAVAQRSQLNQLRQLADQYHLLKNGRLDDAGKRVPNLPFEARKRISSIFDFFGQRDAVASLQPLFAATITEPTAAQQYPTEGLRRMSETERLFAIFGIQEVGRYQTQEFVATEKHAEFYTERKGYALGEGRYWLDDVQQQRYPVDASMDIVAEVATTTGNFRLRAQRHGRDLLLDQLRADGRWQPRLTLGVGALADSLVRVHGSDAEQSIELPTNNFALHAADKNVSIRLFLQSLSREERQQKTYYYFNATALLEEK